MVKYSTDRPIGSFRQDEFGREEFAKKIAQVLLSKSIKESYSIGLYAPWGYGKTSVLGLIEEKLGSKAIIVKYNPWAYSDQESMARGLLIQLASTVIDEIPEDERELTRPMKVLKKIPKAGSLIDKKTGHGALSLKETFRNLIGQYSELTGAVNTNAGKGVAAVSNLISRDTLDDVRRRVEAIIKKCNKRVIVIIDDVDRLDKDEIFQLFKLVKIVTNFDGVTYLIAFDDITVSKSLNSRFSDGKDEEAGRKYIEKIIQIPLHLPLIERETLDKRVLEGIDSCLSDFRIEINDDDVYRFRGAYDDYIAHHIDTPRMVNRYINSLKFTLPMVENEVNMADLLLIESIRLVFPEIYNKLRDNKKLMTGTRYSVWIDSEDRKVNAKELVEKIIDQNDDVREILKTVFPSIKKLYDNYGDNISNSDLKKLKRAASVDYYNRYFAFGLTKSDVSDSDILNILSLKSSSSIAAELTSLLKDKPQSLVMTKLKTYADSSNAPKEVALALLEIVNELSNEPKRAMERSPIELSTDLIGYLLKNSQTKLEDYSLLIENCGNLDQLTYLIREVILGSEEKDNKEPILNKTELEEFKKRVVNKIVTESKKQLLHDPKYGVSHWLYSYWMEFDSREATNKYILSVVTDYDQVIDFLTKFLSTWHGGGGSHRGDLDDAAYGSVEKVVDIKDLYEIVIRKHPKFAGSSDFTRMKDRDDGIGAVGTEGSKEFRDALAKQLTYQFERHQKSVEQSL